MGRTDTIRTMDTAIRWSFAEFDGVTDRLAAGLVRTGVAIEATKACEVNIFGLREP